MTRVWIVLLAAGLFAPDALAQDEEGGRRQAPAAEILLQQQDGEAAGALSPTRAFSSGFDLGGGQVRALIRPVTRATVSAEITARVDAIPLREGERFSEGDELVAFDCSYYQAQLAEARAEHLAALRTHENNRQREALNAISRLEVRLSEVEVQRTGALVRQREVIVERCVIVAPFAGRVVSVLVNEFETVSQQTELLEILDDSGLEVALIVPSAWLSWLEQGWPFTLSVDETGQNLKATVERIGGRVDPTSQTVDVYGVLADPAPGLMAGMSGTASFEAPDG